MAASTTPKATSPLPQTKFEAAICQKHANQKLNYFCMRLDCIYPESRLGCQVCFEKGPHKLHHSSLLHLFAREVGERATVVRTTNWRLVLEKVRGLKKQLKGLIDRLQTTLLQNTAAEKQLEQLASFATSSLARADQDILATLQKHRESQDQAAKLFELSNNMDTVKTLNLSLLNSTIAQIDEAKALMIEACTDNQELQQYNNLSPQNQPLPHGYVVDAEGFRGTVSTVFGHSKSVVTSVQFLRTGRLAVATNDKQVGIWSIDAPQQVLSDLALEQGIDKMKSLQNVSEEKLLCILADGSAAIVDLDKQNSAVVESRILVLQTLKGVRVESECEIQPKSFVLGDRNGQIYQFDSEKYELQQKWQAHEDAITLLQYDLQSQTLYSFAHDATLKRWRGTELIQERKMHHGSTKTAVIMPVLRLIVTAQQDRLILYDADSIETEIIHVQLQNFSIVKLAIKNEDEFFVGCSNGDIQVWKVTLNDRSVRPVANLLYHRDEILALEYDRAQRFLVTGGYDQKLIGWR